MTRAFRVSGLPSSLSSLSSSRFTQASPTRLTALIFTLVLTVAGMLGISTITGAFTHPVEEVRFAPDLLLVEPLGATGSAPEATPTLPEVAVRYRGAIGGPAGAPELPRLPVWVEVPAGARVTGIIAEAVGVEELGRVWVRPVAPDVLPGDALPEAVPDPAIYQGGGIYPATWARVAAEGSMRGHQLVCVEVAPVRWEPGSGRLERASVVNFALELEAGSGPGMLERHRVVPEIEARFEAEASRFIRGFAPARAQGTLGVTGAAGQAAGQKVGSGPAGPGPFQPTFRPTTDGSAVEYVIVTSDSLASEFGRLAAWKTQKGVQAVVRTVEWIDQTYPNGVDRAERVRFFIQDAYQNWGTLFVLLGGDTDVLPFRYGETTYYFAEGESIPADLYFACLDGNWNADGDARFGEGASGGTYDYADLLFEVAVGRAPASTPDQAATFVDKTLLYDANPPDLPRYPASILVLAERIFESTHGAVLAEMALEFVPPWVTIERVYEESVNYPGSAELTRESAIDSINAGFGIVHHVGHGYRNSMSVGAGTLNNADADNLINGPRNSVVFAINCSAVSIDFNSIGERFVKNPNGGSIAYIGTSRLAFVTPSAYYQNEWYEKVFADSVTTIGLATEIARMVLIPASLYDGSNRWNMMATILLGDPETDLYTNAVIPMQVSHPASVAVGSGPITVTVSAQGAPVDSATVTLWREGETYARATTAADGTAELPITADTPGSLILTAHRSYYRPYTDTLAVTTASGPYLYVQSFTIVDDGSGSSSGDGDGQADAGETIELGVTLRNGGSAQATGVVGILTAADSLNVLTILQGTVTYGTIAPGGASAGGAPFVIAIDPAAPVAYQPILTVTATGNEGPWEDLIALPLKRPYLEHYAHEVDDAAPRGNGNGTVEAGEEIHYRVTLRNSGQDRASAVTGSLRVLSAWDRQRHPLVTLGDSISSFGTINPGAEVEGDRFAFTLDGLADPSTVLLELILADDLGQADLQLLDVLAPTPPDSFAAFGSPTSIRLHWKRSPEADVKGYDIFRSSTPDPPFERLNTFTADGTAAYEDLNLGPLTRYFYRVVARDSSHNASAPSQVITASTNPPLSLGWPQEIGQQSASSPVIADIDGGPHIEILCGAEIMYAWHGDGTEVVDGDQDPRSNGPLSLYGFSNITAGFSATPAVGDLNFSGELQIANVGHTRDSLYVWDNQGELLPQWPKWVFGDFNWGSSLLADLDLDGDLEVVLWAGQGNRLFLWHHDGSGGLLVQLPDGSNTFNYSSPAVANLDADPELEILVAINYSSDNSGSVHAFNIDGSPVPDWPFVTGEPDHESQVTASIAVADLDRSGTDEVIIACERDDGLVYVLNGNASVADGWPKIVPAVTRSGRTTSPSIADISGDGLLDIVFPDTDGELWVWNHLGVVLGGFPVTYYPNPPSQASQSTASIGDIDGDGELEMVFGDERGRVHAYNHDGTLVAGFPIQVGGEVRGTPALWDLDRDNLMEIAVVSFDTNVYVWDLPAEFNPTRLPWPFFRHDTRNTGRFITPVQQIGIGDPGPAPVPVAAAFHPIRPNPFNPSVALAFEVPGEIRGARPVTLNIYDVNGRLVRGLVDGPVGTGHQAVTWDGRGHDGRGMASGVYFARITIGDFTATRKLTMIR